MKNFFVNLVLMACVIVGLQSCDPDPIIEGSTVFLGTVTASPATVKNGENVTFSIAPGNVASGGISISTEVNGKDVVKSISYYINGSKVATSKDKSSNYSASYTVTDLAPGEYSVTAHCTSNFKGYTIEEYIEEAKIIVQ